MTQLTTASREWATRPDDQRFVTLEELRFAVARRRQESWTAATPVKELRARVDDGGLGIEVDDPTSGRSRVLAPTNWSFSQLSQYAGAPAHYLRKLPAELAAINLQWGLERMPVRDDALVLAQSNGEHRLRAMTSTTYGRIWDMQVVQAVERVNHDGRWKVPAASYAASNPKRATTLYASDRDVFIFLVDDQNPVEVNGEQLFRGFITWNSEVGSAVFGLTTFLYRYVCDNRIVWGATDVRELRIRHTGGAPERFAYEGAQYLTRYANEATERYVDTIEKADRYELDKADRDNGGWESWLQKRGFTKAVAKSAVDTAEREEGEARSLWDIVNGITANARNVTHTDDRVTLETQAGKLLKVVQ